MVFISNSSFGDNIVNYSSSLFLLYHQLICVCGCASRVLFLGPTQVAVETWASVGLRPAPQPGDVGSRPHVSPAGSGESFSRVFRMLSRRSQRDVAPALQFSRVFAAVWTFWCRRGAQNSSGCVWGAVGRSGPSLAFELAFPQHLDSS